MILRDHPGPAALPDGELTEAVVYGYGSDERFLRHLWRDLYGDAAA